MYAITTTLTIYNPLKDTQLIILILGSTPKMSHIQNVM